MKLEDVTVPAPTCAADRVLETVGPIPEDPTVSQVVRWIQQIEARAQELEPLDRARLRPRVLSRLNAVEGIEETWWDVGRNGPRIGVAF